MLRLMTADDGPPAPAAPPPTMNGSIRQLPATPGSVEFAALVAEDQAVAKLIMAEAVYDEKAHRLMEQLFEYLAPRLRLDEHAGG